MSAVAGLVRAAADHLLVQGLGWALLHSLWQGLLAAAVLGATLPLMRGPRARYAACCATLALLVALLPLTFWISVRQSSIQMTAVRPATAPVPAPPAPAPVLPAPPATLAGQSGAPAAKLSPTPEARTASPSLPALPGTAPPSSAAAYLPFPPSPLLHVSPPPTPTPVPSPTPVVAQASHPVPLPPSADTHSPLSWMEETALTAGPYLPWAVLVWTGGVLILSLCRLRDWALLRRIRSLARPAAGTIQQRANELAQALGIGRAVRIIESAAIQVPAVAGCLKPVILLPLSAVSGLPPDHLASILAHELAHIRRHDYLVNLLQTVAETLLFHHPAVWWLSTRIRAEREFCCDDLAVSATGADPLVYSRALAAMEELRPAPGVPRLAPAATGGPLLQRVRRLVSGSPSRATRPALAAVLTSLVALAASLALLVACTPDDGPPEDDEPVPPAHRVVLPDGATVELLAAEFLDTTLTPNAYIPRDANSDMIPVRYVVRVSGKDGLLAGLIPPRPGVQGGGFTTYSTGDKPGFSDYTFLLPEQARVTTVGVTLTRGGPPKPRLVATYDITSGPLEARMINDFEFTPSRLSPTPGPPDHLTVTPPRGQYSDDRIEAKGIFRTPGGTTTSMLPPEAIDRVLRVPITPFDLSRVEIHVTPIPEPQEILFPSVTIKGSPTQSEDDSLSTGSLTAPLSGGGRLELVGIRDFRRPSRGWWNPDGTPARRHFAWHRWRHLHDDRAPMSGSVYELAFRYYGPEGRTLRIQPPEGCTLDGGQVSLERSHSDLDAGKPLERAIRILLICPRKPDSPLDLRVRASDAEYQPVATWDADRHTSRSVTENGITIEPPKDRGARNVSLEWTGHDRYAGNDLRPVIRWRDPKLEARAGFTGSAGTSLGHKHNFTRSGVGGVEDIARIEIQGRGHETVAFRDLALSRRRTTDPAVEFLQPEPVGTGSPGIRPTPALRRERPFVRFSNGTELELTALGDLRKGDGSWWTPEGEALRSAPSGFKEFVSSPLPTHYLEFSTTGPVNARFKVEAPGSPVSGWRFPGTWSRSCDEQTTAAGPGHVAFNFAKVPPSLGQVRVGVATGPWRTLARFERRGEQWVLTRGGGLTIEVVPSHSCGTQLWTRFAPPLPLRFWRDSVIQAIAENSSGARFPGQQGVSGAGAGNTPVGEHWSELSPDQIAAIEYVYKPYEYATFRDIPLRPIPGGEPTAELLSGQPAVPIPAEEESATLLVRLSEEQKAATGATGADVQVEAYALDEPSTIPAIRHRLTALCTDFYSLPVPPGRYLVRATSGTEVAISQGRHRACPGGSRRSIRFSFEPGAALAGRVVDAATSRGVEGVTLLTEDRDRAVTDAEGHFRLFPVRRKVHEVTAIRPGYATVSEFADARTTGPGEILLVTRPAFIVTGTVKDTSGRPAAGVQVGVLNADFAESKLSFLLAQTKTDEEGRYRLEGLSPESLPVQLVARGDNRYGKALISRDRLEEQESLDVPILLNHGGAYPGPVDRWELARITGRVTANGKPIPGAKVSTYLPYGPNNAETHTDGEGRYTLEVPRPAAAAGAEIRVQAPGLAPAVRTLTSPDEATVDVTLSTGYSLGGRVTDPDGAPIRGASVIARGDSGLSTQVSTDAEGRFLFSGLTAARSHVMATAHNLAPIELRNVDQGTTGLVLQLPRWGYLSGRVLDARTGRPVSNFRVSAELSRHGNPPLSSPVLFSRVEEGIAVKNDDGRFHIVAGTEGAYVDVTISSDWYGPQLLRQVPLLSERKVAEATTSSLPLTVALRWGKATPAVADQPLTGTASIQGSLSRIPRLRSLIRPAEVLLLSEHQPLRQTRRSDPQGGFTFENLAPGKWQILSGKSVASDNVVQYSDSWNVALAEGEIHELASHPDQRAEVSGRIVRNGKPLAGARVTITPEKGTWHPVSQLLGEEGAFSLGVTPGRYRLLVEDRPTTSYATRKPLLSRVETFHAGANPRNLEFNQQRVRAVDLDTSAPIPGSWILGYRRVPFPANPRNAWVSKARTGRTWEMAVNQRAENGAEVQADIGPGTWLLRAVSGRGGATAPVGWRIVDLPARDLQTTAPIDIPIGPNGALRVSLRDAATSNPVPRATIQLVDSVGMVLYPDPAPGRPPGSRSDVGPEGIATYPALPPGDYTLFVTNDTHSPLQTSVTIAAGRATALPLALHSSGRLVFRLQEIPATGYNRRYPFIGFQIHRTGEPETPVLIDGRGPAHGDYLSLETDVYTPGQTGDSSALPLLRPIPLPPGEYSVQAGFRLDWHPQSPTLHHDQWTTNTTVTIRSSGDTALEIEGPFAGVQR